MGRLFQTTARGRRRESVDTALDNDDPFEKQSVSKPPRDGCRVQVGSWVGLARQMLRKFGAALTRSTLGGSQRPGRPARDRSRPRAPFIGSLLLEFADRHSTTARSLDLLAELFERAAEPCPAQHGKLKSATFWPTRSACCWGSPFESLSLAQARRQFPFHPASIPDRDGIDDAGYNGLKM